MENKIKIFENEEFGKIRTVIMDGEPWFVLADICKILEISNSRMVAGRLESDRLMQMYRRKSVRKMELQRVRCAFQ